MPTKRLHPDEDSDEASPVPAKRTVGTKGSESNDVLEGNTSKSTPHSPRRVTIPIGESLRINDKMAKQSNPSETSPGPKTKVTRNDRTDAKSPLGNTRESKSHTTPSGSTVAGDIRDTDGSTTQSSDDEVSHGPPKKKKGKRKNGRKKKDVNTERSFHTWLRPSEKRNFPHPDLMLRRERSSSTSTFDGPPNNFQYIHVNSYKKQTRQIHQVL